MHAPVFILDAGASSVLHSNAALRRILPGALASPTAAETDPVPLADLVGTGAAGALATFLERARQDPARRALSLICETPQGALRLIMHLKPLPAPHDHWAVTVDEQTLFFQGGEAPNAEATFRRLIQALPIGIDLFDASWRAIFFNAYSDSLYQYDPFHDDEHHEWFERAFPDPGERAIAFAEWEAAQAALEQDPSQPRHLEWRVLCRDGEYRTLENMMCKIGTHYAFIYWDISERRRLEDELRRLAETDMLTGIANRRRFLDRAEQLFAPAPSGRAQTAFLLLLDLDHFKALNDNHGHRMGDEALIAVAGVLARALRPGDLAARFGGEEFALLLQGGTFGDAEAQAEAIRAAIAALRLAAPSGPLTLTTSIGLAAIDGTTPSLQQAIENADRALYAAKRAGRNRVVPHRGADAAHGIVTSAS